MGLVIHTSNSRKNVSLGNHVAVIQTGMKGIELDNAITVKNLQYFFFLNCLKTQFLNINIWLQGIEVIRNCFGKWSPNSSTIYIVLTYDYKAYAWILCKNAV